MSAVSIRVHGTPSPQGSKTIAHTRDGRTFLREDNRKTEPWRKAVKDAIADDATCLTGVLRIDAVFSMPRPKKHYRASGELRPDAPDFCSTKPDIDKLLRSTLDALTLDRHTGKGVIGDDCLVVEVHAQKVYGDTFVGADITIATI